MNVDIRDLGPPRWVWVGFLATAFVILVGVAGFLIIRSQDNAVQLERQDCARRIAAEQMVARDKATSTSRALYRYFFGALLESTKAATPPTQAQIDEFAGLVRAAEDADTTVNKLPDLAEEVERRCPG
jgi:hypothetical protein